MARSMAATSASSTEPGCSRGAGVVLRRALTIRCRSWWRLTSGPIRPVAFARLPRPVAGDLHFQREAQEGSNEHDPTQHCDAAQVGPDGDGADDVGGDQQLQAEQDRPAELLAKRAVDLGIRRRSRDAAIDAEISTPKAITATPTASMALPTVSMTSKKLIGEF